MASGKLTQARANKLAKNPGTRSKVPTAMLSPKLQAMRKANAAAKAKNAALDDPAALTAPLTPRTLGQQVQASTDLQYGGAEQDLAGQQRQAAVVATSIPAWFQQYRDASAAATQATRDAAAAAVQQQQTATDSTYALDTTAADKQRQAMQADATLRGTTVDPAIAAQAQQAALSRRSAGDSQTRLTAGLGAAQTSYRAGQETTASAQQLRAQLDQQGRQNDLGAKGQQLAKDKGNYATTVRQKLIDSEHTKQIENKAFDLNVQKEADAVKTAAAHDATSVANTSARNATSAANTRANNAAAAARNAATIAARKSEGHLTRLTRKATAATIASSGVTPAEQRRRNTAVRTAEASRTDAVNGAVTYAKHGIKDSGTLRTALQEDFPSAPKEVIDYALAAALGSKAGVTKKGQLNAAQRYRQYLKKLADGTIAK